MNNSLNIEQINQFICVDVIIYKFEEKCNTRLDPSERQVSEYHLKFSKCCIF